MTPGRSANPARARAEQRARPERRRGCTAKPGMVAAALFLTSLERLRNHRETRANVGGRNLARHYLAVAACRLHHKKERFSRSGIGIVAGASSKEADVGERRCGERDPRRPRGRSLPTPPSDSGNREQAIERVEIDRLDEMMVEARLPRAL